MKDLIIIGAGPAGMTAAIYGIRAGLDLILIERLSPGGQVVNTYEVENYPGFIDPIRGWDLVSNMEKQARRLGVEIMSGEVASVRKKSESGAFLVQLEGGGVLEAKSVIAAAGATYRKLDVPGVEEFIGKGVSFCATCDGAFFKDRSIAVIGGGNSALEEVHFLTKFAKKIYLIHRRDRLRADKILQDRIFSSGKIEQYMDSVVESISGNGSVEKLHLKNLKTGRAAALDVNGVFILIGFDANTDFLPDTVISDEKEVIVDMRMKTPLPGLFAAGDIRSGSKRQIVMAAADGATAAMEANEYIAGLGQ
jgi:thioredoxin reductase (NADPH)